MNTKGLPEGGPFLRGRFGICDLRFAICGVTSSRLHTALLRRLCGVTGILSLRDCLRKISSLAHRKSQIAPRTSHPAQSKPCQFGAGVRVEGEDVVFGDADDEQALFVGVFRRLVVEVERRHGRQHLLILVFGKQPLELRHIAQELVNVLDPAVGLDFHRDDEGVVEQQAIHLHLELVEFVLLLEVAVGTVDVEARLLEDFDCSGCYQSLRDVPCSGGELLGQLLDSLVGFPHLDLHLESALPHHFLDFHPGGMLLSLR